MRNKTPAKKKLNLFSAIVTVLGLPVIASFSIRGGLPPVFDFFPQSKTFEHPGFSWRIFVILGAIALFVFSFVLFPRWFGFKESPPAIEKQKKKGRYPLRFWAGGATCLFFWLIMWGQFQWAGILVTFAFVPMWWGFIYFLDGIVYKRTGGKSLASKSPWALPGLGLFSIFAWEYYEYLSFFALGNWYYPNANLIDDPLRTIWFGISFSTVWPAVFEWYMLLNTFEPLKRRYRNGPVLSMSTKTKWLVLFSGAAIIFFINVWPHELFWLMWVGPELIVTSTLVLNRIWTPFASITKGNWSPIILIGLAALCNSLFWEMWNYYSWPGSPNAWHYNIPYIQILHIFEMPALGYTGYLFFGVSCWVVWILFANLIEISPVLVSDDEESFIQNG